MTAAVVYEPDPALSYWPTPAEVADDLVYSALVPGFGDGSASVDGEVPQVRVLEPSAGEGHLARVVRQHLPGAHITAVEPSPVRAAGLRGQGGLVDKVHEVTLEAYLAGIPADVFAGRWQPFDLVVANPPFTLDGRPEAWAEHVLALWHDPNVLAAGGTLAAVVPRIVMTGSSKKVRAVRGILGDRRWTCGTHPDVTWEYRSGRLETCARGAFDPVGARLSTVLLWAFKPVGGVGGE